MPTSALWAARVGDQRAKRLLFTGDLIDGRTALEWGLAIEAPPASELDERFEALLERIALTPVNQLVMMKQLVNQALYAQGLHATQTLGVYFDGIARHTPEGHAFQRRAAEAGWREAVRERDEPYGGCSVSRRRPPTGAGHAEGDERTLSGRGHLRPVGARCARARSTFPLVKADKELRSAAGVALARRRRGAGAYNADSMDAEAGERPPRP